VTHLEDTGKPLKLQGPAGTADVRRLTEGKRPEYSFGSVLRLMPERFTFFVAPSYASYWWWYRTVTEGARAV
jgi:hypothetical protein